MIDLLPRLTSRTLLPILGAIAGLATVGLASARAHGATYPDASAVERGREMGIARDTVIVVRHRTENHGASGSFSPKRTVVYQGDLVRFETDGLSIHNVSFSPVENEGAASLPESGPYLTRAGQAHEIRVDLEPGVYRFQCDPHAAMGERGILIVREAIDMPAPVTHETR
jgi:plastocyanin